MTEENKKNIFGLHIKITLLSVLLISLVSCITGFYLTSQNKALMWEAELRTLNVLTDSFADHSEYSFHVRDYDQINKNAETIAKEEDILFALALDHRGEVLANTDKRLHNPLVSKIVEEVRRAPVGSLEPTPFASEERGEIYILSRPILTKIHSSASPVTDKNTLGIVAEKLLGHVVVVFSSERVEADISKIGLGIATIMAIVSAIIIACIFLFTGILVQKIELLRAAFSKIREGKLHTRVKVQTNDELEELADDFNSMVEKLEQTTVTRDALIKEIAERKKAEKESIESQELFKMLSDTAPVLIWMTDQETNVSFVNKAWLTFVGQSMEHEQGHGWVDEVFPEDKERLMEVRREALKEKQDFVVEYRLKRFDGQFRWLLETAKPRYSALGEYLGYIGACLDVTDRKESERAMLKAKEAAEGANRSKNEFLANMSHEIRTPLNAVIGFCDLLMTTKLDDQQKDFVQSIGQSGDLLLGVITDILDFSKIEAKERKLEQIDFNLEHLIDNVLKMARVRVKQQDKVRVYMDYPEDIAREYNGDPTAVRQILLNLLTNAAKFTEEGEICIHVELDPLNPATPEVVPLILRVRDTGLGIPEAKQAVIFESFTQVDTSTTRKYGGTGLGLAITKSLVELLEGTVNLKSEEGKGSEFSIAVKFSVAEGIVNKKIEPVSDKVLQKKTAVIVDDNEKSRFLLEKYCAKASMKSVLSKENAESIIDWLENTETLPDILLCDLLLPEMSGYELAEKIRKSKKYGKVKMIAVTSDVMPGVAEKARQSGYDAFLSKPLNYDDFVKVVRTTLGDDRVGDKKQIITRHLSEEVSLKGLQVLVVEDNVMNQKLIDILLRNLGCVPTLAGNGKEALEKIKENDYNLCLMDLQMPVMGGVEAVREIRQTLKLKMPVLALTAAVTQKDINGAYLAGMNDYLTKPVSADKLKEKVSYWAAK